MKLYKIANDVACKPHPVLVKRKRRDSVPPTVNAQGLVEGRNRGAAKENGLRCALSYGEVLTRLSYTPDPRSLAVHIAPRETDQGFSLAEFNFQTRKTAKIDDSRGINPKRSVPVLLVNDGAVPTDAMVLLHYIDQFSPGVEHISEDTLGRFRALAWMSYRPTEIDKSFTLLLRVNTPRQFLYAGRTHLCRKRSFVELHFDENTILLESKFSAAEVHFSTLCRWLPDQCWSLAHSPNLGQFLRSDGKRTSAMVVPREEVFNKQRKHSPPCSRQHHSLTPSHNTTLA